MKSYAILTTLLLLCGCQNNQQASNPITGHFKTLDLPSQGITFEHQQAFTKYFKIHEPLGSGVAVIDINNDGQYELFFAQFDRDDQHSHIESVLYQKKNKQYHDITSSTGLSGLNQIMGAAVADINNDGWSDLLVYGYQQLHIMINQQGTFKKMIIDHQVDQDFYTSATFFDANNDEWLDLWLSTYVEVETTDQPFCKSTDGHRMHCAPAALPFQKDQLLINNAGQSFSLIDSNLINIEAAPALGVVAADFNQDGLTDIYVANDGQNNFLFTQQVDGSFIEQAQQKGVATNLAGLTEASMGIAVGDYDNDGLTDVFLTHIDGETNTLYKNEKNWFSDVTNTTGLGSNSRVLTGFGTGFYDLNGDNWLDLFVNNGRIQAKAYQSRDNLIDQFSEQPLMYFNRNGQFDVIENISDQPIKNVGRGLAFVDLDNDGDKDIITTNNNQKPIFLQNQLNPQTWLGLNITCNNRTDIGAQLHFNLKDNGDFYRTIHTDGSYVSTNDPRIIIYLDNIEQLTDLSLTNKHKKPRTIDINTLKTNQYQRIDCLN